MEYLSAYTDVIDRQVGSDKTTESVLALFEDAAHAAHQERLLLLVKAIDGSSWVRSVGLPADKWLEDMPVQRDALLRAIQEALVTRAAGAEDPDRRYLDAINFATHILARAVTASRTRAPRTAAATIDDALLFMITRMVQGKPADAAAAATLVADLVVGSKDLGPFARRRVWFEPMSAVLGECALSAPGAADTAARHTVCLGTALLDTAKVRYDDIRSALVGIVDACASVTVRSAMGKLVTAMFIGREMKDSNKYSSSLFMESLARAPADTVAELENALKDALGRSGPLRLKDFKTECSLEYNIGMPDATRVGRVAAVILNQPSAMRAMCAAAAVFRPSIVNSTSTYHAAEALWHALRRLAPDAHWKVRNAYPNLGALFEWVNQSRLAVVVLVTLVHAMFAPDHENHCMEAPAEEPVDVRDDFAAFLEMRHFPENRRLLPVVAALPTAFDHDFDPEVSELADYAVQDAVDVLGDSAVSIDMLADERPL